MKEGRMTKNSLFDASNVSPPLEQSPELTPQREMVIPIAQQVESNSESKQRTRGIVGLIIGIIVLMGLLLPFIVAIFGGDGPAAGAMISFVYAPIYICVGLGGTIACATLLILTLVDMGKHKIRFSRYIIMTIVGFLLTFSPYVYLGVRVATDDGPSEITASNTSIYGCHNSMERATNEHWSDTNSLGGSPEYIAEDIVCSYLEYFYDHSEEPSSSAQLSQYYQSYNAKNSIAAITINEIQPDEANIYNIITHRSCAYYDTKNDSAISVWFRDEGKNNNIRCVDITATIYSDNETHYLDLYNLEQSRKWFEEQFKVETSVNE